jgi:hypothetical protein
MEKIKKRRRTPYKGVITNQPVRVYQDGDKWQLFDIKVLDKTKMS